MRVRLAVLAAACGAAGLEARAQPQAWPLMQAQAQGPRQLPAWEPTPAWEEMQAAEPEQTPPREPTPRQALQQPATLAIEAGMAATSNGALSPSGQERADVIASVRPRFAWVRRGPRLHVDVAAALGYTASAEGTQSDSVRPELRAFVRSELVERLFYVDGGIQVGQAEVTPYGTRVDDLSSANRRTATSFRVSPYLWRDLSEDSFVLARQDVASSNNGSGTAGRLLSTRSLLRYERRPAPWGVGAEISRLDNEFHGSGGSRLSVDTLRATGSLALRSRMVVTGVAGLDRSDFAGRSHTDPLYGVRLRWLPGPRTLLDASVEQRFFGTGGSLMVRHRTPFMSFSVSLRRGPASISSTLGQVDEESDLRPFLDAILTTRYPDPSSRQGLVQTLVGDRALDVRLPSAVDSVAGYPQLSTGAKATWALLDRRNTGALTLYTQTLRQLTHSDDPAVPATSLSDNRQSGVSLQLARRLTPLLTADAYLRWSKITGLAGRAGETSQEVIERVTINRALSPRTGLAAGVQHNRFTSTATGQHDYRAMLVFVALRHRF